MSELDFKDKLYVSSSYNPESNPWVVHVKTGIVSRVNEENLTYYNYYFSGINDKGTARFHNVIEANKKLFFLADQYEGNYYIELFDINQETVRRIELPYKEKRGGLIADMVFTGMVKVGEYIFYVGYAYPAIVRVNVVTEDVDLIDGWFDEIEQKISTESKYGYFISRQYVIKDGWLYIPFCAVSAILKINLESLQEEIIFLDVSSEGFSCVAQWEKNKLILTGAGYKKDQLYIWDENTGNVLENYKMQNTSNDFSVFRILVSSNKDAYIFPWQNWGRLDVDIYYLDKNTMELKKTSLLKNEGNYDWGDEIIYANWKEDNLLQYVTGKDMVWHEYNIETGTYLEYEMNLDKEDDKYKKIRMEYYKDLVNHKQPIKEGELHLEDFLKL